MREGMTSDLGHSIQRGNLLRVGDIAKATGKTVRAIHLYEELGLLAPVTRSSGGFRLYDPAAIERVRWIDLLHGLGFSLQEMRELRRNWWNAGRGTEAMSELRALFARKLDETREAIRRHQRLERELEEGLAYLETCRECADPGSVQTCVQCEKDHGAAPDPALIAGIRAARDRARHGTRPAFVRVEDIQDVSTEE